MSTNLTRALKVLSAATILTTAIASPSLAGAQSVPYYHDQPPADQDAHRGDWEHLYPSSSPIRGPTPGPLSATSFTAGGAAGTTFHIRGHKNRRHELRAEGVRIQKNSGLHQDTAGNLMAA